MKKVFGAALIIVGAVIGPAHPTAAGEVTGRISQLVVRDSDQLVWVQIAGTMTGRPACAAGYGYWMIPNENSETGKKLYAMLLGAKLADRPVLISGKNTCTRFAAGEDIDYVVVLE